MPWIFLFADTSPIDLVKILGHAPFAALPATLDRYQVSFTGFSRKWNGAVATLSRQRENRVYGSASLISAGELPLLDQAHAGLLRRPVRLQLVTEDVVEAQVYGGPENQPPGEPSKDYLKALTRHLSYFWTPAEGKFKLEDCLGEALRQPEPPPAAPEPLSMTKTADPPKKRGRPRKSTAEGEKA